MKKSLMFLVVFLLLGSLGIISAYEITTVTVTATGTEGGVVYKGNVWETLPYAGTLEIDNVKEDGAFYIYRNGKYCPLFYYDDVFF